MESNNKHLDDEKLEAVDISLHADNKKPNKFKDFWYHNKWTIIIVTFFVTVALIVAVQLLTKVDYDVNVTLCGPDFLDSEEIYYIANDLSLKLDSDINGDGRKTASINTYPIFSDSELFAINHSQKDKNGNYIKIVEESENLSQYNQFTQYTQTGDSYIFIVSKYIYDSIKDANQSRLMPLDEIYGNSLPEGTLNDGYGIKLSDTKLYSDSTTLQGFGDDYILCIFKLPDMATKKQQSAYEKNIEYFKNLVG